MKDSSRCHPNRAKEKDMKATVKTLLTALLSVTVLGMGANAYADGRGDRDGWKDRDRYEQRWDGRRDHWRHDNGRHEGWRHHDHHRHVYRSGVYYYPAPVIYGPPVYRYPRGASVIIDLPPIVIR